MRAFRPVKLILLCLIIASGLTLTVFGAGIPSPTQAFYVNDFAGVLDGETEQYIIRVAAALEERTTAQLVVVTVSDIGDQAIEEYANDLFNKWGIGSSGKDNGVLILLDIGGRQSRIEVGYGLEGALPDGKTGRIQDNYMIPYFKQNNFNEGIRQGFNALLAEIYTEYGIDIGSISDIEPPVSGENGITLPKEVLLVVALLIVLLIVFDARRGGGLFTFILFNLLFRGGRGGRGGGGFTIGGGGRSGGGGSTRRW
ncbi:MAG: TPM domain-containing protein [Clostridiales bacterium]|nr:TPM domain-containing protein [Clostridiales bacterium]HOA84422.1 TPM domain-containing protein [Bacillota bacterium]